MSSWFGAFIFFAGIVVLRTEKVLCTRREGIKKGKRWALGDRLAGRLEVT